MSASRIAPKFLWLFGLAVLAGLAFKFVDKPAALSGTWVAWKATGVVLLAVWAALNARDKAGWTFTAVMALGALGDVVLEYDRTGGGLAFLAGHLVAIWLYLSHRRTRPTPSQLALALVLLIAIPLIAFLLPTDRTAAPGVVLYATGLGAMAASAWLSRFPRYRVGIGAFAFAASDLLIFASLGPLADSWIPRILIWPLYFGGQALIAWGVVSSLIRWRANDDLHHRL
jgi:uncharacterized membrane protein YhhN